MEYQHYLMLKKKYIQIQKYSNKKNLYSKSLEFKKYKKTLVLLFVNNILVYINKRQILEKIINIFYKISIAKFNKKKTKILLIKSENIKNKYQNKNKLINLKKQKYPKK